MRDDLFRVSKSEMYFGEKKNNNTCNVNYKMENQLSLYLETSKCFTFQSHHSKFVVIKLSELPERNVDFIGRSFFENFPNSCLIIFYFQNFIQAGSYFLGKKLGGGDGSSRPLPLLRH